VNTTHYTPQREHKAKDNAHMNTIHQRTLTPTQERKAHAKPYVNIIHETPKTQGKTPITQIEKHAHIIMLSQIARQRTLPLK
jgi:hypothetical protein